MFDKVKEMIQDADYVLVGLGEEFEEKRLFAKDAEYVELTNELQEKELHINQLIKYIIAVNMKLLAPLQTLLNITGCMASGEYLRFLQISKLFLVIYAR